MNKHIESKHLALGDNDFLTILAHNGYCWHGQPLTKQVEIVAVEGAIKDWAAYVETPYCTSVIANGDKLPREVAEQIFPEWAKKYTWRY